MDVSATFGTTFSQIITGSGTGTVYTVPSNKYAVISVSKEKSTTAAAGGDDAFTSTSQSLSLTIGGVLVQQVTATGFHFVSSGGAAGGSSVTGFASAGSAVTITDSGNGTVRYQILELNVVTT